MERSNEESMLIKLASVDSINVSFFCVANIRFRSEFRYAQLNDHYKLSDRQLLFYQLPPSISITYLPLCLSPCVHTIPLHHPLHDEDDGTQTNSTGRLVNDSSNATGIHNDAPGKIITSSSNATGIHNDATKAIQVGSLQSVPEEQELIWFTGTMHLLQPRPSSVVLHFNLEKVFLSQDTRQDSTRRGEGRRLLDITQYPRQFGDELWIHLST